jgi:small subunit ribosomal protein S16
LPVKIRLKRIGAKKRPVYRIVVANSTASRDGRFIETIGHYDPCVDPPVVKLDEEKALRWLGHGAQPTDITRALLKKQGILDRLEAAKLAARQAKP